MTEISQSFTLRLTAEDQRLLAAICTRYTLNRADGVRRALRDAQPPTQTIPTMAFGIFTPVAADALPPIPIRLKQKDAHG